MIDWHHPRIYERLRCFGLSLFSLGLSSHNVANRPAAIAAIIVTLLLVIRLKIELDIGRDEEERKPEAGDQEKHQPQVLRGERPAEEVKAAHRDVEEDGGITADLDPRQQEVDRNQDERRPGPGAREAAGDVGGKHIPARPVVPDGGDGIERGHRRWRVVGHVGLVPPPAYFTPGAGEDTISTGSPG